MKKLSPKAPPVDIRKIIRAAAEAALEQQPVEQPTKKRRLSGGRAVMLGAGLFTAGRLLIGGRGTGLVNSLQDRLAGLGAELPGNKADDVELDDEELADVPDDEIDDLVGDEPEDELVDDEPDDEPEADEDEPEAVAHEDEDVDEAEEPSDGAAPERRPRRQRRGR